MVVEINDNQHLAGMDQRDRLVKKLFSVSHKKTKPTLAHAIHAIPEYHYLYYTFIILIFDDIYWVN